MSRVVKDRSGCPSQEGGSREAELWHRDLMEAIADLIWETEADGRLKYVSGGIRRLLGYLPDEVIGKEYSVLMPSEIPKWLAESIQKKLAEPCGIFQLETTLQRKDGACIDVDATISSIVSEDNVVGYRGIVRDISHLKGTEASLKRSELLLSNALALSRAAPWEFDVASGYFKFNDMFYALFGTTVEEVGGYEMLPADYAARFMFPEDVPLVADEIKLAVEDPDPNYSRNIEHRFRYADGRIGILAVKIRVLKDEAGRTIKTYGVNQDITEHKQMEEELGLSKAIRASAVECSLEGILIVDPQMRISYFNNVFVDMWRVPKDIQVGSDEALLAHAAAQVQDTQSFLERVHYLYSNPSEVAHDKLELKDGRAFDRDTVSLYGADGCYLGRAWFFRDATERTRAERALRESEENFRAIFSTVREGIFVIDPERGTFVEANASGSAMFGYSREDIIGSPVGMLEVGEASATLESACKDTRHLPMAQALEFDWRCRRRTGEAFWAAVSLQQGPFRGRQLVLATVWDITERKKAEATILQMACYDSLTGLLNRRVFLEELEKAIARTERSGRHLAVLYLDLDHFKDVNDILGHRIGDLLLKEVSRRLRSHVRATDVAARVGGDEFAIMAVDLADPEDAGVLARKLLRALDEPYVTLGNEVRSGTSIGIAVYGAESPGADALITHADVALYRAKAEGRGTVRFFTEAMDREVKARVSLSRELRTAITEKQLELYYQPQVNLLTGDIHGVEALVRWNHPRRGLVGPHEFIEAAEQAGLIIDLGRWVLDEACRQARVWLDMGLSPGVLAVNISALQFRTAGELEKDVVRVQSKYALPSGMLELELTETVLMDASRRHGEALQRLRDLGVRVSIDDFGMGYSSLDYLRRFPVDRLKIAQDFVADLEQGQGDRAIVRAALGLARELGLGVIAEGIETSGQLALLRNWGCREGQGFYFAVPQPAAETTELLRHGSTLTTTERGTKHAASGATNAENEARIGPSRVGGSSRA